MFTYVEKDGVITPKFKRIKARKLTDDTVLCTLGDLIKLLGEERALNFYAIVKSLGSEQWGCSLVGEHRESEDGWFESPQLHQGEICIEQE